MTPGENDPLWRLRHALLGVGLAVFLAVLLAAFLGSALASAWGGGYHARVATYAALLVYVLVGAGVLFVKVAQHETQPSTPRRVGLWLASLWLWPLLLVSRNKR